MPGIRFGTQQSRRTASPSKTPDQVAGLVEWHKPESLDTSGYVDNDVMNAAADGVWEDSTTNNHDQTPNDASTIIKTGIANGKTVVRFDGATGWCDSDYAPSGDGTFIMVLAYRAFGATNVFFAATNSPSTHGIHIFTDSVGQMAPYGSIASSTYYPGYIKTLPLNQFFVLSMRTISGRTTFKYNGTLIEDHAGGPLDYSNTIRIGASHYSGGGFQAQVDFAELAIYDVGIAEADEDAIILGLKTRYAIIDPIAPDELSGWTEGHYPSLLSDYSDGDALSDASGGRPGYWTDGASGTHQQVPNDASTLVKTAIVNGYSVVRFDGTGYADSDYIASGEGTYIVVLALRAFPIAGGVVLFGTIDASGTSGFFTTMQSGGALGFGAAYTGSYTDHGVIKTVTLDEFFILSVKSVSGRTTVKYNGTLILDYAAGPFTAATQPFRVGAQGGSGLYFSQEDIAELHIYNVGLSAGDEAGVIQNFKNKYGIA